MEIRGDEYSTKDEQTISTAHLDDKLTVKAIDIQEV
jgi:hypothetical protein